MQRKRAIELQAAWGSKPCAHAVLTKEYDLGERTGEYACAQCGKFFTFRERAEHLAAIAKK